MEPSNPPKSTGWSLIRDYLANSNIHGIRYIINVGRYHWVERVWWFLVLAVAFGSCSYFIVTIYQQWQDNPVILVVSSGKARRWDIPFPAITVCPGKTNQLRPESGSIFNYELMSRCVIEDVFEQAENNVTLDEQLSSCLKVTPNDRLLFDAAAMVCIEYNETLHTRNLGVAAAKDAFSIIRQMAPQLSELSMYCRGFFDTNIDCGHLFSEVMTEVGLCFTINTLNYEDMFTEKIASDFKYQLQHNQSLKHWTPDSGYSEEISDSQTDAFPYRSLLAMGASKQYVYVSMENHQDSLNDTSRPSGGCDRDVGYYCAVHPPQDFPVYLQLRMHVGPQTAYHSFVHPKVVKAIPQIRQYPVSKRNCLFSDEGQLHFFRHYTRHNCELECMARMALQTCQCVHFSMPRDDETPVCSVHGRRCVNSFVENFQQGPLVVNRTRICGCLPECNSVQFSLSSADMSESIAEQDLPKASMLLSYQTAEFPTNNRVEVLSNWSFLAACGGLLSLFMGFSLLSLAELLYFLTVRWIVNIRKSKKN